MITNDNITAEYGSFRSIPSIRPLPQKYKPSPIKADYDIGFISRAVVLRRNDPTISREIDPTFSANIDNSMYQMNTLTWRISGKRDRTVVNGVIEDFGVSETNLVTIKKLGSDVERLFTDPLEFWRGY